MTVVIRMPGVDAPSSAKFQIQQKKRRVALEGSSGETSAVAYEGQAAAQKYCLAVKNRDTGALELVDVPVMDVTAYVKEHRENELNNLMRQSGVKNWIQRNALGEAFGTKRAKTAISNVARNRVDADMLEDMESVIVDSVKDATSHLPTPSEREQAAERERPIPTPNLDADNVEAVYPVESIVPKYELEALNNLVDEITVAGDAEARAELLPSTASDLVNSRIDQLLQAGSNRGSTRNRLRILVYMSFLRALYDARRVTSKDALLKRFNTKSVIPDVVVDGALRRFTISKPGAFGRSRDRSFAFDPFNQTKLLCYFLALTLHVDGWVTAITPLAHELALKPSRLAELFRQLGAAVKPPTAVQARELGLNKTEAATFRIASLTTPVALPDIRKRRT